MAHDMPGADSIGHLCATALVFISLFTLGWGVAVIFAFLHSVHAFPDQIFELVSRLEVGLIYSTLQYAESFSLPVSCASFARSWRKMMPRQITEPLLEGFWGRCNCSSR